jgi:L-asparagine oxygenase
METIALSNETRDSLGEELGRIGSPHENVEDFLLDVFAIFSHLPKPILRALFRYRIDPGAQGALLLTNFPVDEQLPETPADGGRSPNKRTFISEGCALGVAQLLGEAIGYGDEKNGELVQNLCPLKSALSAPSNESSAVDQGFHTDLACDRTNPTLPFNLLNPDFVVLVCLRSDHDGEACTRYVDAREICKQLNAKQLQIARFPIFEFAATYSFCNEEVRCGGRTWCQPTSILAGPERYPELSIDLCCGMRGLDDDAKSLLSAIREICARPEVASGRHLKSGDVLLMNNRKGVHSRSRFTARFDGHDRWVQRVYVRRSLWQVRHRLDGSVRIL